PGHDDLHKFHIVRPVIETVDDPWALVNAVACLDQGIDPVIIEPGPAADHVNDMYVGGVKMETCAAFGFSALTRGAHQLYEDFAVCGCSNAGVPIDEERTKAAVRIAGFGRIRLLMTECRFAHVHSPRGVRRPHPALYFGNYPLAFLRRNKKISM